MGIISEFDRIEMCVIQMCFQILFSVKSVFQKRTCQIAASPLFIRDGLRFSPDPISFTYPLVNSR